MALILQDTKGAKFRGVPFETVMIKDRLAIRIFSKCKERGVPRLFSGTSSKFSKLYLDAVTFYRLSHPKPTPHGIQRGGGRGIFSCMAFTTERSNMAVGHPLGLPVYT